MTNDAKATAGQASAMPRSLWWRIKYRVGRRLWWVWLPICSRVQRFAEKRTGMGETFSTFWYGVNEGSWTVVCGDSLTEGIRHCIWIWRGCP